MRTRSVTVSVVLLALALTGCSGDPAPAPTITVTAEPVAAELPDECSEAFTEIQNLLAESTDIADAWDEWTAGELADWLAAPSSDNTAMMEALRTLRADKTTFVNHVKDSEYKTLRDTCLAG